MLNIIGILVGGRTMAIIKYENRKQLNFCIYLVYKGECMYVCMYVCYACMFRRNYLSVNGIVSFPSFT
jgi:hypothetical protein